MTSQIEIHPLAVTCLCDHYTRVRVGGSRLPANSSVIGILFGRRDRDVITVLDATDAVYDCDEDGNPLINKLELAKKITLWTAIGEDRSIRFLGWYSFGSEVTCKHLLLHDTMAEFGENILFVLTSPNPNPLSSETPFCIYQKGVDSCFVIAPFKLETVETERIAVDQIVKSSASHTESAEEGLLGMSRRQAALALRSRVNYLISTLIAIERGDAAISHEYLRRVSQLCCRFESGKTMMPKDADDIIMDGMINAISASVLATSSRNAEFMTELNSKFLHAFAERQNVR